MRVPRKSQDQLSLFQSSKQDTHVCGADHGAVCSVCGRIPDQNAALAHMAEMKKGFAGTIPPMSIGGEQDWRKLVHWPSEHRMTRRYLQLWAWEFRPLSYILLRPALQPKQGLDAPARSSRRAVVATALRGTLSTRNGLSEAVDTAVKCSKLYEPQNVYGDDLVTTKCDIYYSSGKPGVVMVESDVFLPNALALRYVTEAAIRSDFLEKPLADETWDYTCEHPDHPCVRQPGPPSLVSTILEPLRAQAPVKRQVDFDDM